MVTRSPLYDGLSRAEKEMLGEGRSDKAHVVSGRIPQRTSPFAPAARAFKQEVHSAIAKAIPEYHKLKNQLDEINKQARLRVPDNSGLNLMGYQLTPPPEVSGPRFQWVQTTTLPGDMHGLRVEQVAGSEVVFKGKAEDLGDDRVVFTVGTESFFVITTQSMVSRSTEIPPLVSSSPMVSLFGYVFGHTGLQFILSYGDKWAKCRLRLKHDVRQITGAPGSPPIILASEDELIPCIDEENNVNVVLHLVDRDPYNLIPTRLFTPDAKLENVFARVEIGFEVELEGKAMVGFVAPNTAQENQTPLRAAVREWAPLGSSRWLGTKPPSQP